MSGAASALPPGKDCGQHGSLRRKRCHNQVMAGAEPSAGTLARLAPEARLAAEGWLAGSARVAAGLAGLAAAIGAMAVAAGPGRFTTYAGSSAGGDALTVCAGLGLT